MSGINSDGEELGQSKESLQMDFSKKIKNWFWATIFFVIVVMTIWYLYSQLGDST